MTTRRLDGGILLSVTSDEPVSHGEWSLGRMEEMVRFVALYRHEPFWMRPKFGRTVSEIPHDVQWLFYEKRDGSFALYAPLLCNQFRASLHGGQDNLTLHVDSGDPSVAATQFEALYIIEGVDPHVLASTGAHEVSSFLKIPLRSEKSMPKFIGDFGWCTWDAFYRDVTPDGVIAGLQAFEKAGVSPGFVILDDGWLQSRHGDNKEEVLTSFLPNRAFGGDLTTLIEQAKSQFGVRTFLVWHALNGYWGGADPDQFEPYAIHPALRQFAPGILAGQQKVPWWVEGTFFGPIEHPPGTTWLVHPEAVERFFDDFHQSLKSQGADGVKVDNQAALESLGEGLGGRVELTSAYRKALEKSVNVHFEGNLINCMSCGLETLYSPYGSNLVRSSDDFYPQSPETHSRHVVTNALFGFWFGNFVLPDWDMFHSNHAAGTFHAAARALSGGPIYVSDKPGEHDFSLINRLILSGGRAARTIAPAVPTADSLLADTLSGEAAFKIYAPNASNWIIGAFNCCFTTENSSVTGAISSDDIPQLRGAKIVAFRGSEIIPLPFALTVEPLGVELVTLAPLVKGFALLGLSHLLNPGAGVGLTTSDGNSFFVETFSGGEIIAYSENVVSTVLYRCGEAWTPLPMTQSGYIVSAVIPEDAAPCLIEFRG